MYRIIFGIFFGFLGAALGLMMQVGPHDAATNLCNWSPFPASCLGLLPGWFDQWGWLLPTSFFVGGAILIAWAPIAGILHAHSHWSRMVPLHEAASDIYGEIRGTDLARFTEDIADNQENFMSAHSIPEQKPMLSQAGEVHNDPYPSQPAMEAAVELEVHACLGRVQTQTVGKVIQRAIDKSRTWQPIETAPRDGTLFLAYVPDSSISEIVFCRRDAEDEDWMMDWGNEATVIDIPVTHWMPLPEAPE